MQIGGYLLRKRRRRSPVRRTRRRRSPSRRRNRNRTQSKSSVSRSTRRRYSNSRKRRSPTRRRRTPLRRRPVRRNRRRGRGTVKIIKLKGRARLGGNQSLKNLQKMKFQDLRRGVRMFSLL